MVIGLRVFPGYVLAEYIVTGTGESVAAHAAVVLLLICSLAEGCKTNNHITRTDVCVVDNITAFHATGDGAVHDYGANQITYIGSLTACGVCAYTHIADFGQQFISAVYDGAYYASGNKIFVPSDG